MDNETRKALAEFTTKVDLLIDTMCSTTSIHTLLEAYSEAKVYLEKIKTLNFNEISTREQKPIELYTNVYHCGFDIDVANSLCYNLRQVDKNLTLKDVINLTDDDLSKLKYFDKEHIKLFKARVKEIKEEYNL